MMTKNTINKRIDELFEIVRILREDVNKNNLLIELKVPREVDLYYPNFWNQQTMEYVDIKTILIWLLDYLHVKPIKNNVPAEEKPEILFEPVQAIGQKDGKK